MIKRTIANTKVTIECVVGSFDIYAQETGSKFVQTLKATVCV